MNASSASARRCHDEFKTASLVLGPAPARSDSGPSLLARVTLAERLRKVPARLPVSMLNDFKGLRQRHSLLRSLVTRAGAIHISQFDLLCNDQSCLATIDQTPDILGYAPLQFGSDFVATNIISSAGL